MQAALPSGLERLPIPCHPGCCTNPPPPSPPQSDLWYVGRAGRRREGAGTRHPGIRPASPRQHPHGGSRGCGAAAQRRRDKGRNLRPGTARPRTVASNAGARYRRDRVRLVCSHAARSPLALCLLAAAQCKESRYVRPDTTAQQMMAGKRERRPHFFAPDRTVRCRQPVSNRVSLTPARNPLLPRQQPSVAPWIAFTTRLTRVCGTRA